MSNERCPSCGATLRADAPWCSLCYAPARREGAPQPAAEPASPAAPVAVARRADLDPLTAPYELVVAAVEGTVEGSPVEAYWPCARCGTNNAMTEQACTACGARFLALDDALDAAPLLRLPGAGPLLRLSRGGRLVAALGLAALMTAIVAGLFLVVS